MFGNILADVIESQISAWGRPGFRVDPKGNGWCPQEKGQGDVGHSEESQGKAEITVMLPQTKECQEPPGGKR